VSKITKDTLMEISEAGRIGADKCRIGALLIRPRDVSRALVTPGEHVIRRYIPQISTLLAHIKKAKRGRGQLCLGCETEFSKTEMPDGFIIIGSIVEASHKVMVTAICSDCGKRSNEELLKLGSVHIKTMWADARVPPDVAALAEELRKKGDYRQ
jgi:hypothetical protein